VSSVNVQPRVEVDHKKEHDLAQTLHQHMVEKNAKDLMKMNDNVDLILVQLMVNGELMELTANVVKIAEVEANPDRELATILHQNMEEKLVLDQPLTAEPVTHKTVLSTENGDHGADMDLVTKNVEQEVKHEPDLVTILHQNTMVLHVQVHLNKAETATLTLVGLVIMNSERVKGHHVMSIVDLEKSSNCTTTSGDELPSHTAEAVLIGSGAQAAEVVMDVLPIDVTTDNHANWKLTIAG